MIQQKILLWDNDGTVTGSVSPNDPSKIILPGVETAMRRSTFNGIISGFASPESEAQNFDPDRVAARFKDLMSVLPVRVAIFSPTIGGVECYAVVKKPDRSIVVRKAHEDERYKQYIGEFKKPGIGMFVVMRDIAQEVFGIVIDAASSVMIGDTWHDQAAATRFGIPFVDACLVHQAGKQKQCCC